MDWGLAKILPRGGVVADAMAGKEPLPETPIATARSGSDADLSQAGSITDHDYADAFREAGIDLATLPPAEAAAKIRARPTSVVLGLTAALDDWAGIRRVKRNDYAGAMRLRAATRVADPDPWHNELRGRLDDSYGFAVNQRQALQALAKAAKFEELGPVSLQLLGSALAWKRGQEPFAGTARRVLRTKGS
jgi:hypothetical protein